MVREEGNELLKTIADLAGQAGVDADTEMLEEIRQKFSKAIVDEARRWKADLIVMGTHGRIGIARLVPGSVAEGTPRRSCAGASNSRPVRRIITQAVSPFVHVHSLSLKAGQSKYPTKKSNHIGKIILPREGKNRKCHSGYRGRHKHEKAKLHRVHGYSSLSARSSPLTSVALGSSALGRLTVVRRKPVSR